jgi:hypothetical protein
VLDGHEEPGGVGVGVQRVGGDHGAGQVQADQQRPEGGDLTRGAVDLTLASTARLVWSIVASRWTCRP